MRFRSSGLTRFVLAPAAAAFMAFGCAASPTAPDAATEVSALPASGGSSNPGGATTLQTEHLNPTELSQRGWTCVVPPPTPQRIVCNRPNQPFPSPTIPVSERAPTFTLLVFDSAGNFLGTQIGIREDLYAGQTCESTGTSYIFRPPIGYYECLHTVGG